MPDGNRPDGFMPIPRLAVPDAVPKAHPQLGAPDERYVYADEAGKSVAIVYRYDKSDNRDRKEFRPYDTARRKWKAPDVRPLYRLDALARCEGEVVLVEGEKCADALNDIGILATTAFGGSNGVGKTDFRSLKNRHVIIWPDNDEPGLKYAEAAAVRLRDAGAASVRMVDLSPDTLAKTESRYGTLHNVGGGDIPCSTIRNEILKPHLANLPSEPKSTASAKPVPMMLPHLHQRDEQDDASRGNAQSPYRSQGGATGVDAFDDIHPRHMCVKLRCRLTGPECRLLATNRHSDPNSRCPMFTQQRTSLTASDTSVDDPQRILPLPEPGRKTHSDCVLSDIESRSIRLEGFVWGIPVKSISTGG